MFRALLPVLCLGALIMPAAAALASESCDLHWQVTARLDAVPRHLAVRMSFDGGTRQRSTLELPGPWAGVDDFAEHLVDWRTPQSQQTFEPVPGRPGQQLVRHRAGERVVVQYQVTAPIDVDASAPRADSDNRRTLLGRQWFQLFGHAWLANVNDIGPASVRLCIDFEGLPEGSWWIGSHGAQQGSSARIRLQGSQATLRDAVFLGGDLQVRERRVQGRPVWTVMPPHAGFAFDIEPLSARVAQMLEAPHALWRDTAAATALVVLQPNHAGDGQPQRQLGAVSVHRAVVMHAAKDLQLSGAEFDALLMREHLRAWIPDRFGPLTYIGRSDEAMRAWFSEGFSDHYAHRLLVEAGLWTLDDYARALNAKIDRYRQSPALRVDNAGVGERTASDPAVAAMPSARGEWLALRWHSALRAKGHPGLDALMRSLLLAPAQAQHQGPLSKPLAMHRLLAALRPWLGETPLNDLLTYIDKGQPFEFDAQSLGPCFALERPNGGSTQDALAYRPLPEGLQQAACRRWMGVGSDGDERMAAATVVRAKAGALGSGKASKSAKPGQGRKGAKAKRTTRPKQVRRDAAR